MKNHFFFGAGAAFAGGAFTGAGFASFFGFFFSLPCELFPLLITPTSDWGENLLDVCSVDATKSTRTWQVTRCIFSAFVTVPLAPPTTSVDFGSHR